MTQFSSQDEAKQYLVGRIVAQAKKDGVPLSDVERRMLSFTESGPDKQDLLRLNDEFEATCNTEEYEAKIHSLVETIEAEDAERDDDAAAKWKAAVKKLREGDHYLLVMIDGTPLPGKTTKRPPGDFRNLILTAIGVTAVALILMFWLRK